ncbi:MAG TPA: hypothetical protein VFV71_08535 [Burkholderiales bacterium]|nr:hypothetical protein [Burkholderiales bacterium]
MRPRFALAGLLILHLPLTLRAEPVPAQFRGCDAAGWCRFRVESPDPTQPLYRVRPDGVPAMHGNDASSIAVRNRLNALMSDFIHQAKHIVLHDLRELGDGTFAASVTVTGIDLASDPVLVELGAKAAATSR